jgi:hypothetical protein
MKRTRRCYDFNSIDEERPSKPALATAELLETMERVSPITVAAVVTSKRKRVENGEENCDIDGRVEELESKFGKVLGLQALSDD